MHIKTDVVEIEEDMTVVCPPPPFFQGYKNAFIINDR